MGGVRKCDGQRRGNIGAGAGSEILALECRAGAATACPTHPAEGFSQDIFKAALPGGAATCTASPRIAGKPLLGQS